jgi:permease for cytosine/purines
MGVSLAYRGRVTPALSRSRRPPPSSCSTAGRSARRGRYDPHDLQAFNQGRRGGRYRFTGGWNLRAVGAWPAGSAFGVCAVSTSLYSGPLANLALLISPEEK